MPPSTGLRQPTQKVLLQSSSTNDQTALLGVVGLRTRLTLHLEAMNRPRPTSLAFVVDSGASYSLISLDLAQSRRIAIPPPESETVILLRTPSGPTSMLVRPGRIRGWWNEEHRGYSFDWPVLFRVDSPRGMPSILGLGGVVKTCQWLFDGTYAPESPYGSLTLNDTRCVRLRFLLEEGEVSTMKRNPVHDVRKPISELLNSLDPRIRFRKLHGIANALAMQIEDRDCHKYAVARLGVAMPATAELYGIDDQAFSRRQELQCDYCSILAR